MSSPDGPPNGEEEGADTQMFRAFVEREDTDQSKQSGTAFRLITLAIGLLVFAGIVWLLLK